MNQFYCVCFADLKKYRYNYWFCFPAFVTPTAVMDRSTLGVKFTSEQREKFRLAANLGNAKHQLWWLIFCLQQILLLVYPFKLQWLWRTRKPHTRAYVALTITCGIRREPQGKHRPNFRVVRRIYHCLIDHVILWHGLISYLKLRKVERKKLHWQISSEGKIKNVFKTCLSFRGNVSRQRTKRDKRQKQCYLQHGNTFYHRADFIPWILNMLHCELWFFKERDKSTSYLSAN